MDAAARAGIEFVDRAALGLDAVDFTCGGRTERVLSGRVFSHLSVVASRLCDDKLACKRILSSIGVAVPEGAAPAGPHDPVLLDLDTTLEWVVKPRKGTHGDGVRMGLRGIDAVRTAVAADGRPCLVERQIPGADLRLQAVGGSLVAACRREPASLVGDGRATVAALMRSRQREIKALNPENDLALDAEVQAHLADAGIGLADVPESGQVVVLRSIASMATGGRAIDVTDTLHPQWAALVARIAAALGLRVFAVDAISPDPARPPTDGAVLEVNARPEWLHHTFSERARHDIPTLLLLDLFDLAAVPSKSLPGRRP